MIYCAATQSLHRDSFLEQIVRDHVGIVPMPRILRMSLGKPYLAGYEGVGLSYSHTGNVLFAAVGRGQLGADVERVRERRQTLPRYVMSEREFAWFEARGSQWMDFYQIWTLKEARVKCTGQGIRGNMRAIAVPLMEPQTQVYFQGFTFRTYRLYDCCGAICAQGKHILPKKINYHEVCK